jgi:hypothetical protein
MDRTETDDESVVGEIAHIVARDEDGNTAARAVNSISTADQTRFKVLIDNRNKYGNLILLCRIHHKQVDDQPNTFTVDKLLEQKKGHELWVKSSLEGYDPRRQRDEELYADYVDRWVELFDVRGWDNWTSWILSGGQPSIRKDAFANIDIGRRWLLNRVWPRRFPSLERAFDNFRRVAESFYTMFDEWKEDRGDRWLTEKFYKRWYDFLERDVSELHRMEREFDYHVDLVQDLALELTRAANWICDEVRSCLDPSFLLNEGRLTVTSGPDMHLRFTTFVVEYQNSGESFTNLDTFKRERSSRDRRYGSEPE